MAVGDLQAAGNFAYRAAIDIEVDAYLRRRVIPKLMETVRPDMIAHCREEQPIEKLLLQAERDLGGADILDYDAVYSAFLEGFRDLLRQGLDQASIEIHVSMP